MEIAKITPQSTNEIYKSSVEIYNEQYADIRKQLDYTYHNHYTKERQVLQDKIITELTSVGRSLKDPWLIYTAGPMGSGKSFTIRKFSEMNIFPLIAFVIIDPDRIKCMLPEMKDFIEEDPFNAGLRVHKESIFIAEIAERQAIKMKKCVLVDGTLKDTEWYINRLELLRSTNPEYLTVIIQVTAPTELIFKRVAKRAVETGRNISSKLILETIEQVPESVKILAEHVHLTITINNEADDELPKIIEPELKMQDGHKYAWFKEKFQNVWDYLEKGDMKKEKEYKEELELRIKKFGKLGCSITMSGGYYEKYMKYKAKYLALKG
jgi:dephospho-CoA kinase